MRINRMKFTWWVGAKVRGQRGEWAPSHLPVACFPLQGPAAPPVYLSPSSECFGPVTWEPCLTSLWTGPAPPQYPRGWPEGEGVGEACAGTRRPSLGSDLDSTSSATWGEATTQCGPWFPPTSKLGEALPRWR